MTSSEHRAKVDAGRDAFNRGEYFAAHERWEEAWLQAAGPARTWLQGLVQLAAALHKLDGGRADLACSLLQKALAKLADAPDPLDGLSMTTLRADAASTLSHLRAGTTPPPLRLDAYP